MYLGEDQFVVRLELFDFLKPELDVRLPWLKISSLFTRLNTTQKLNVIR